MSIQSEIISKYPKQGENKLLDVSNMDTLGKGIKKENPPGPRSKKVYVPGVPIMSNNFAAYQAALTALGPDYQPWIDEYYRAYGNRVAPVRKPYTPRAGTKKAGTKKAGAKKAGAKKASTKKTGASTPRQAKPLVQRLPTDPSKVLDVSHLERDGHGARVTKMPGGRTAKRGIQGLPMVSDNYRSYELAVRMLGPEYQGFASAFFQVHGDLAAPVRKARSASPARKRSVSRTRVRSLMDKVVAAQAEGKFIDVSNMQKNGKGTKKSEAPKGKSKKHMVPGMPVISNNATSYKWAMELLGPDYLPYHDMYVKQYGNIRRKVKAKEEKKKAKGALPLPIPLRATR